MEPIWQAELLLLEQMQQIPLWVIQFFKGVTFLGNESFYMLLLPIFYWCINMRLGYRFTLVLLLSNWINSIFKMLCHFPRPYWLSPDIKAYVSETSFGLPSGHSTNAASIWLFLANEYKKYKLLAAGFVSIMLLIMISRLFLGVHFFSDVISGFLLGVILLVVIYAFEKRFSAKISTQSLTTKILLSISSTIIFLFLGLLPILINTFEVPSEWIRLSSQATDGIIPTPFAAKTIITLGGVWLGMNIGYSLLLYKGHPMQTSGALWQHGLRLAIGLSVAILIRMGLSVLFDFASGNLLLVFDFIRYAVLTFWIAYLAPMLFLKINLYKKTV